MTSCLATFVQTFSRHSAVPAVLWLNLHEIPLTDTVRLLPDRTDAFRMEFYMSLIGSQQFDDASSSRAHAATADDASRPVRLLLVDDHPDTLCCMAKLFTSAGYAVHTANNAKSALDAIAQEHFDVLISDLGMVGMNGYDLMRKVRQKSSSVGIAVSGYGMPADIEKSHRAGFMEHFVKPIDFKEVLNAVARAVALRGGAI